MLRNTKIWKRNRNPIFGMLFLIQSWTEIFLFFDFRTILNPWKFWKEKRFILMNLWIFEFWDIWKFQIFRKIFFFQSVWNAYIREIFFEHNFFFENQRQNCEFCIGRSPRYWLGWDPSKKRREFLLEFQCIHYVCYFFKYLVDFTFFLFVLFILTFYDWFVFLNNFCQKHKSIQINCQKKKLKK